MTVTICASKWTGRAPYAADGPIEVLLWKIRAALYPTYDCECCVGQEWWRGCYCSYYGAVAPNTGPETWRVFLRRLFGFERAA